MGTGLYTSRAALIARSVSSASVTRALMVALVVCMVPGKSRLCSQTLMLDLYMCKTFHARQHATLVHEVYNKHMLKQLQLHMQGAGVCGPASCTLLLFRVLIRTSSSRMLPVLSLRSFNT
jgi:hypothetical protein